jgi:predicted permease
VSPIDFVARAVVRFLTHALPPAARDDMIGDLLEQYRRRRRLRRVWLIVEACDLAWGFGFAGRSQPRPSTGVLVDIWLRDILYALRSLLRSRGFTAVATISLALGLGLSTAVFSVIDGVLLRPLPYGDASEIVRIRQLPTGDRPAGDNVPRWLLGQWEGSARTLSALAPYSILDARIRTDAESLVGIKVEAGEQFFDVLRTAPLHGRLLSRADADRGAPPVAVLSHGFWSSAFGQASSAIGRRLLIDDRSVEIVGVLPPTFTYPSVDVAVFVPGRWRLPEASTGAPQAFVGPRLDVVGRMRKGMNPADVVSEARSLFQQQLKPGAAPAPALFEVIRLQEDLARDVRPALIVLLAAVGCVLAIVCVNLTNLLLARGTVRQREMAVRAALGASRWRMTRPLALEGVLLSLVGGAAGLALAAVLVALMPLSASVDPMLAAQVRVDGRVLVVALAVSGLIGLVVGVLPAWQSPVNGVTAAMSAAHVQLLPGASLRAEHVRSGLVVVQVALAIVLGVAAALLSRSLAGLLTVDLGFRPENALSLQIRLPPTGGTTFGWRARFYEEFLTKLGAHPGVHAAGFSTSLPTYETFSLSALRIDGVAPPEDETSFRAHREVVTPDYFRALGMTVTRGRVFLSNDIASSERVLVVNDAFVTAFLAGREPLDHRVLVFGDWSRIIGVVRSKRHAGLRSNRRPEFYTPLAQSPPDVVSDSGAGIVLRSAGAPLQLLPFVRSTLRALQPEAAIENETTLEDRIWSSTAQPRFYTTVMAVFATLALATALVGLYGVLSYVVERRRTEIGVRRALGATGRNIFGLIAGRGLKLIALAVPLGVAGAAAGAGLLRNLLFGIEPVDPVAFAVVVIIVPTVALASCLWPARRAAGIEPVDALREQ